MEKKWVRSFWSQDHSKKIKRFRGFEALSLKRLTLNNINIPTSSTLVEPTKIASAIETQNLLAELCS